MIQSWWMDHAAQITRCRCPIDWWHSQSAALRQFMRGWGANQGKQMRLIKADILSRIQRLDAEVDGQGLDEEGWDLILPGGPADGYPECGRGILEPARPKIVDPLGRCQYQVF
jgi:hypothetical protein